MNHALRVIVLGETSAIGKKWLQLMEEENLAEVHAATDTDSIFEDYEKVGEIPVVLVENYQQNSEQILSLRKSNFPNYVIWFGGAFSKEDYAFAVANRVYAVLERPDAEDEKIRSLFSRLELNVSRSAHFNNLVQSLKSILVQLNVQDDKHPLSIELKAATVKLQDLEAQNEFTYPNPGNMRHLETPLLAKAQEDLGDAIESMEDLERTGALWVRGSEEGQEGRIEFLQGRIVFAEAGETTGVKAIYRMFLWSSPKFLYAREMVNEVAVDEHNLKYPIGLVAQGRRYKFEYETIREELPPREISLAANAAGIGENLEITAQDFRVLASVIEFGRVSEIVDYSPLSDFEVYHSLIQLRKANLIQVAHTG